MLRLCRFGCTNRAAAAQNAATPLHNAAWKGHLSVVTLLLGRGADKEAKTGKVRAASHASLLLRRVCAHAGGAADGVAAAALRGVEEPRSHHRGAARERRRRACERRRALAHPAFVALCASRLLTRGLRCARAGRPVGAAPGGEGGPRGMRSPAFGKRRRHRRRRQGEPLRAAPGCIVSADTRPRRRSTAQRRWRQQRTTPRATPCAPLMLPSLAPAATWMRCCAFRSSARGMKHKLEL